MTKPDPASDRKSTHRDNLIQDAYLVERLDRLGEKTGLEDEPADKVIVLFHGVRAGDQMGPWWTTSYNEATRYTGWDFEGAVKRGRVHASVGTVAEVLSSGGKRLGFSEQPPYTSEHYAFVENDPPYARVLTAEECRKLGEGGPEAQEALIGALQAETINASSQEVATTEPSGDLEEDVTINF